MKDNLEECSHCKGDCCYVTQISPEIKNYICYGCGFQTNSIMKKGENFYNEQFEILPELHKELAWEDEKTNLVWIPNTINIQETGMVFANGANKFDWNWSAVRATDIPEGERSKFPIPNKEGEFYKKKMDMKTLKEFPSRKGFLDAMDYIGIFGEPVNEEEE